MIYLVEITAAIDAAGTTTVLRYGSDSLVTSPADVPANTWYEGRLTKPVDLGRNIADTGKTGGDTRLELGVIEIANADGALDGLANYGIDGRPVVVRIGNRGAGIGAFSVLLTAAAAGVEVTRAKVTIKLRDKALVLDKPVCAVKYAGSNVLPAGLEGAAADLKDHVKPRLFGAVTNISPPCVNTSRLTYQVSDGAIAALSAVYDRGVLLTAGAVYASQAEMEANAPAAGQYRAWLAGGYFRVGSSPAGTVTCDAAEGATAADRTPAQVMIRLAKAVGLAAGDIAAADVVALDTACPAECGIWLNDDTTALNAMDAVAPSAGAWWGFDRLGLLRLARLALPTSAPVVTLTSIEIEGIERLPANDSRDGVPVWRTVVNYARNYTVQDSDLAGAVTADRRAWLVQETRSAAVEDATVKAKHLLADVLTVDTLLTAAADATTEAARLQAIYGVQRDLFKVQVHIADAQTIDLGQVVRVVYHRFGLGAGRSFLVIGAAPEAHRGYTELTLWG